MRHYTGRTEDAPATPMHQGDLRSRGKGQRTGPWASIATGDDRAARS